MKSKHFDEVKGYYDRGLWSATRVLKAVECGWITREEYELIVGDNA